MKLSIKEMILISLFTALSAIGAFLSIPMGNVPITLQSMFVILSGLLLGPKLGALSQLVYILLGLSGVRIFAEFSGGPQVILKPSFGFLIGFIFASYIVGKIARGGKSCGFNRILIASLAGTSVVYLFGVPYMYLILNTIMGQSVPFSMALKTGCIIFLPGDLLKAILASWVGSRLLTRVSIEK